MKKTSTNNVQQLLSGKLEMLQRKYRTKMNEEPGSMGRPVLRFGRLLPWSLFLLAHIHTVDLCAEAVTHTSCLVAEGCFKVSH